MKRILIVIAVALAVSPLTPGSAQSGQTAQRNNSSVEEELLRLERDWLDAYVRRDVAMMDRIVADDFTITYPNGEVINKTQTIADLKRPDPQDPSLVFTTEDTKVRVYGDTAVLTGRVIERRRRNNQEVSSQSRYTDTYVKRQGRWQVVASHLSRLPAERTAIRTLDPQVYDAYVGQYELGPGRTLTITKEANTLQAQPTGQSKFEMFPESETRFFLKGPDVQIIFVKDDAGKVSHLILQEGGQNVQVRKKIK